MSKMPKKAIQKMLEAMIQQDEIDRKLVTSPEYLAWLVKFTSESECVNAGALEYFPSFVSNEDRYNASKLPILFHIIKCYAEKEGIRQEIDPSINPYELGAKYIFAMQVNGKKKYFLIGYYEVNVTRLFLKKLTCKEFVELHVAEIDLEQALTTYQQD